MSEIITVPASKVVSADWNYKKPGTKEELLRLADSIIEDNSAGVLAVREIERDGQKLYESIDGNHRLEAINTILKWDNITLENFGKIPLSKAVTIARRRNHQWFEDDKLKLAKLMSEEVLPQIGMEKLVEIGPDTQEDIENLIALNDFEWEEPQEKDSSGGGDSKNDVTFRLNQTAMNKWVTARARFEDLGSRKNKEYIFELILDHIANLGDDRILHMVEENA